MVRDTMASGKSKRRGKSLAYNLKRIVNFVGLFARNTRGILGLIIIGIFVAIALFPWAFTPYDAVNDRQLSGFFGAPTWLKSLPTWLGGRPNLTENYFPMVNSGFQYSNLTGWNWTQSDPVHTSVRYEDSVLDHNGILHINFSRDAGVTYGNVTTTVYQTFYFPYSGPPFSFHGQILLLINGTITNTTKTITYTNFTNPLQWPRPEVNITANELDVPIKVTMYFESLDANASYPLWPLRKYYLYTPRGMEGMALDGTIMNSTSVVVNSSGVFVSTGGVGEWIDSSKSYEPIDSWARIIATMVGETHSAQKLTAQVFFPPEATPGSYRVGVEVTFVDTNATKPVTAEVYLDTLDMNFKGTSWGIMGADHEGRDLWSQLIYGTRISLYVGVLSTTLAVVIGLVVGLMAGYLGRVVDEFLMRVCDVLLVLPGLPLLIVLVAVLGTSIDNLIILLGALGWMGFARVVRSQVISLRERPFIEAAKAVGAGKTHIMFRHILPNVMSLVYVTLATTVPGNIVAEASLGFLGFTDPNRMSWGLMLNEMAANTAYQNWWWVLPPGLCIALIAIAFILFGYALDEVLNPRLRLRR